MLKFELVRIWDRRLWFGSNNGSNTKTSEIRMFLFGFQTKICVRNPNEWSKPNDFYSVLYISVLKPNDQTNRTSEIRMSGNGRPFRSDFGAV